jgi:C4-dicarboxylate-specific signal transduction histidine kinase
LSAVDDLDRNHVLAQPLTAVMANAQALQKMVSANGAAARTMRRSADIEAGAVRAAPDLRSPSTMAPRPPARQEADRPAPVIEESLSLLATTWKRGESRQPSSWLRLPGRPTAIRCLLQQVLVNLVRNAMDALSGTPPAE